MLLFVSLLVHHRMFRFLSRVGESSKGRRFLSGCLPSGMRRMSPNVSLQRGILPAFQEVNRNIPHVFTQIRSVSSMHKKYLKIE